jgi:hypothetical protein
MVMVANGPPLWTAFRRFLWPELMPLAGRFENQLSAFSRQLSAPLCPANHRLQQHEELKAES